MKTDLGKNEIEIAIAEIKHNIECVIEAQENAEADLKKYFTQEKQRLSRLLNKFIKMREEVK